MTIIINENIAKKDLTPPQFFLCSINTIIEGASNAIEKI